MIESTRRSIRTAFQVVIGVFLVTPAAIAVLPLDREDTAWILGIAAASVIILTKLQNVLEENGVFPTFLKDKPE